MAEDPVGLVHEWYDKVWNQGIEEAIDRLLADGAVAHGLVDADGNELRGPDGFKPFFRQFREAFPDIRVTIEDTIADGDKVAARYEVRGTHLGHSLGMVATNNPVHFTGMTILRAQDGKIAEAWNMVDFATMTAQLSSGAESANVAGQPAPAADNAPQ